MQKMGCWFGIAPPAVLLLLDTANQHFSEMTSANALCTCIDASPVLLFIQYMHVFSLNNNLSNRKTNKSHRKPFKIHGDSEGRHSSKPGKNHRSDDLRVYISTLDLPCRSTSSWSFYLQYKTHSSADDKCYKKRWDDGREWELRIVSL